MIGRDTSSALAPVVGPKQKHWLCHPAPLFVAVSMMSNMWPSSCCWGRHSWLTKFGVLSLNQLVLEIRAGPSAPTAEGPLELTDQFVSCAVHYTLYLVRSLFRFYFAGVMCCCERKLLAPKLHCPVGILWGVASYSQQDIPS